MVLMLINSKPFASTGPEIQVFGMLSTQNVIAGDFLLLAFEAKMGNTHSPEKIAYTEIVNSKGTAVEQVIFELNQGKGQAILNVSNDLPSGYYLVRAYTKGSRLSHQNFGVFHQWVGIINPQLPPRFQEKIKSQEYTRDKEPQIEIISTKNEFLPNENIEIKLKFNQREIFGITSSLEFPAISKPPSQNKAPITYPNEASESEWIPEIYGPIVKFKGGKEENKNPVLISSSGKTNKFFAGNFDEKGEMILDLGKIGMMDFLTVQSSNKESLDQIFLETSFWSAKPIIDQWPEMTLTGDIRSFVQKIHESRQLMEYFLPLPESDYSAVILKPSKSYILEEYNTFDDLWTVFREYVEEALVRNQGGKSVLRIINHSTGKAFQNGPLILLDGLPILDTDALLKHSPENIREIKVTNYEYLNNGNSFDGVVQLFSQKGDLGEFPVPKDLLLVPFSGVQPFVEYKDWLLVKTEENRTPNLKRLLYWDIHPIQKAGEEYTIEFQASGIEGDYVLEIFPANSSDQSSKTLWRYSIRSEVH
ncbi:hypothetical protein [Mongoliibacter ruber]|nr:hypothetical protein [Mongoliibacter ruber]